MDEYRFDDYGSIEKRVDEDDWSFNWVECPAHEMIIALTQLLFNQKKQIERLKDRLHNV